MEPQGTRDFRVVEYGMKNLITWVVVAMLLPIPVVAQQSTQSPQSPQDSSAMEQRIKDLEERIIALEGQVRMLKATPAAAPAQPSPPRFLRRLRYPQKQRPARYRFTEAPLRRPKR